MSINAINSVSLYEYYYSINKKENKKESPLVQEMRQYGLTPTDSEQLNIAMLKRAKDMQNQQNIEKEQIPNSQRPWADLMYQLNIPFNEEPKDDIQDIKDELAKLLKGVDDEDLLAEIKDLEKNVEDMYIRFQKNFESTFSGAIGSQLHNLSMINQANFYR